MKHLFSVASASAKKNIFLEPLKSYTNRPNFLMPPPIIYEEFKFLSRSTGGGSSLVDDGAFKLTTTLWVIPLSNFELIVKTTGNCSILNLGASFCWSETSCFRSTIKYNFKRSAWSYF